ncbi:MAG: BaiN/RdsA family NAD(P)/FAD-dependent oxidoreductase [Dehalococcoidia bacterium]
MSKRRVVVVGGGAAGMMAAGRAAESGAEVLLLEKMERPGKKVLISGNTRCNLTNALDFETFISMYGKNGKFLYSSLRLFSRNDLLDFFSGRGLKTVVEPDGRIFPASGSASDVVAVLLQHLSQNGVQTTTGSSVSSIEVSGGKVVAVHTVTGSHMADAVILATGGASYPQTGSSGDGYKMAEAVGHSIVKLRPALVPLVTEGPRARDLQGISLKGIRITSFACRSEAIDPSLVPAKDCGRGIAGRKVRRPLIESRTGDIIFTHYGLSGPAVLLMSLVVVDALDQGSAAITIDLIPQKGHKHAEEELQGTLSSNGSRYVQNILEDLVPAKIAAEVLAAAGVSGQIRANQVTALQRESIIRNLKDFRLDVTGSRPLAEAMVTAGGVCLDEVDPRTMQSKLVKGLYLCGEVLDIDADTGGFNLQAAFSTGYLAGDSAAKHE